MSLPNISPPEAKRLVAEGAILIDVREGDEYLRSHIPGACHFAMSRFEPSLLAAFAVKTLNFHCRSGAGTAGRHGQGRTAGNQ